MIRKKFVFVVALIFVGIVARSFVPGVYASTIRGLVTDFSAILLSVTPCTCSGATHMITLDDLTGMVLTLTYMPGLSALKLNYNFVTPGVQFLGHYTPDAGLCEIYVGVACVPLMADGLIAPHPFQGLGTSGLPVVLVQ